MYINAEHGGPTVSSSARAACLTDDGSSPACLLSLLLILLFLFVMWHCLLGESIALRSSPHY